MSIVWTDPQLVLAIARSGSLTGAARTLAIDHSTTFRRLKALERGLGARLFERLPGGVYQPTAAGERMVIAAERIEDEVMALDRDLTGRDLRLSGRLRVTTSESVALRLLMPQIKAFRDLHPGIALDLILDNRVLDLTRREADVAIRPIRPKEGDLWGRKLADVAWAIYATRGYLRFAGGSPAQGRSFSGHVFIGWDESSRRVRAADWIEAIAGAGAIAYRTASLVNQLAAARAGLGLAVLPCYLGDTEPALRRVAREPVRELTDELWIVTHRDLRHAGRMRAFLDLVGDGLARERDLIAGRKPRT